MKFVRNAPIFAVMLSTQLLHQTYLALAGMACFSACSVACCECAGGPAAFAGPLGIAVGVTGCAGVCMVACATFVWVPPACFSNDTTIAMYAPNGTRLEKPISAVRNGDSVLTLAEGRLVPTRVIRNVQSSGNFDFFEFEVRSHHTITTLKVTSQHGMLLVDPLGEMRFALPADVRIGDEMQSSDGSAWKVSRIGHFVGVDKFTLETTEGSVLASGLLVSTICEEEINAGTRIDDIMPGWKARHQYARQFVHIKEGRQGRMGER